MSGNPDMICTVVQDGFNYLVNNISLGRGLGFISLLRRALCSDDKDGNFPDDTTEADDTLEFGRL